MNVLLLGGRDIVRYFLFTNESCHVRGVSSLLKLCTVRFLPDVVIISTPHVDVRIILTDMMDSNIASCYYPYAFTIGILDSSNQRSTGNFIYLLAFYKYYTKRSWCPPIIEVDSFKIFSNHHARAVSSISVSIPCVVAVLIANLRMDWCCYRNPIHEVINLADEDSAIIGLLTLATDTLEDTYSIKVLYAKAACPKVLFFRESNACPWVMLWPQ